jgi:hypothetical protein
MLVTLFTLCTLGLNSTLSSLCSTISRKEEKILRLGSLACDIKGGTIHHWRWPGPEPSISCLLLGLKDFGTVVKFISIGNNTAFFVTTTRSYQSCDVKLPRDADLT